MSKIYDLNWRGDEVVKVSEEQLAAIMTEFGLTAEGEAKKELKKGHGVLTGTLRRSVHLASPDYEYSQDNVEPSESTPERGGNEATPQKDDHRFILALGSGLVYALKIHQGWGIFTGYHYITIGVEKAKKKLDAIVTRHQVTE